MRNLSSAQLFAIVLAMASPGLVGSASAEIPDSFPTLASFDQSLPANWFTYADSSSGTLTTELITIGSTGPRAFPGQIGDESVVSVESSVASWNGFGSNYAPSVDISSFHVFNFWFYGENSGILREVEIQGSIGASKKASFRDDFAGWQLVSIPLSWFSVTPGDFSVLSGWVFINDGAVGNFLLDQVELVDLIPLAEFEDQLPENWFTYKSSGSSIDSAIALDPSYPAAPSGTPAANNVLEIRANVPAWGGFGANLSPPQDWSTRDGISFAFFGNGNGFEFTIEIQTSQGVDRSASFVDRRSGWQFVSIPFSQFGGGGWDLSEVDSWVVVLDGANGSFKFDHFSTFGDASPTTVVVNGKSYELTTLTGSFEANRSILEQQPWWGNRTLSEQFATALGGCLGYPHLGSGNLGPLFARDDSTRTVTWRQSDQAILGLSFQPTSTTFVSGLVESPLQYAVIVPSDYDTWARDYSGADLIDEAADFDGDGFSNGEEYRFGLNPTLGSSSNPLKQMLDKNTGRFTYTRRDPDLTGLETAIWTSENLMVWTRDTEVIQEVKMKVGDVETVEVVLSGAKPLTASTLFVRVASP